MGPHVYYNSKPLVPALCSHIRLGPHNCFPPSCPLHIPLAGHTQAHALPLDVICLYIPNVEGLKQRSRSPRVLNPSKNNVNGYKIAVESRGVGCLSAIFQVHAMLLPLLLQKDRHAFCDLQMSAVCSLRSEMGASNMPSLSTQTREVLRLDAPVCSGCFEILLPPICTAMYIPQDRAAIHAYVKHYVLEWLVHSSFYSEHDKCGRHYCGHRQSQWSGKNWSSHTTHITHKIMAYFMHVRGYVVATCATFRRSYARGRLPFHSIMFPICCIAASVPWYLLPPRPPAPPSLLCARNQLVLIACLPCPSTHSYKYTMVIVGLFLP